MDYLRVEKAIHYLEQYADQQPSLEEVADYVGLSKYHFQRLFQRWAGVSPKRYLQFLTVGHARELLRQSASVLEATWETGLSSPGRLHDAFVAVEAVSPGEFKNQGEGVEVRWGRHQSPFGPCLLAVTGRGICNLEFLDGDAADAAQVLRKAWPRARLVYDPATTKPLASRAFSAIRPGEPLRLALRGSNFQLKVWNALLRVPEGAVVSYGELARAAGHEGSARAVGTALGSNPVAYLIPCHRVLRASGAPGGYRWGTGRKRAMLAWEQARALTPERASAC